MKKPASRVRKGPRMKLRLFLMSLALCVTLPIGAENAPETPLGKNMESLSSTYKALRKETDPAKSAALARDAQQIVAKCLTETPALLAKMPAGATKAMAAAEFRKTLGKVFVTFCELEQAGLAGKTEDIAKCLESLKDLKKTGHEKFTEEE